MASCAYALVTRVLKVQNLSLAFPAYSACARARDKLILVFYFRYACISAVCDAVVLDAQTHIRTLSRALRVCPEARGCG